jgi:hypothetical protein
MKKTSFVIALFCFLSAGIYAQVKIILVVNKNDQDPLSGALHFNIGAGCYPYTIKVIGRTSGHVEEKTNLYSGTYTWYSLPVDFYDIDVTNGSGCTSHKFAEIKNCNGFDVNLQIPFACNGNPAFVKSTVSGGILPYTFSWYQNGQLLESGINNAKFLPEGTYELKVMDHLGCITMKSFKVDPFIFKFSMGTRKQICSSKDLIQVALSDGNNRPMGGHQFKYEWDDSQVQFPAGAYTERVVDKTRDYNVTVTHMASGCTKVAYFGGSNVSRPYTEQAYIHHIKHDRNNDNKGEITVYYYSPFLTLTIDVYKDNVFFKSLICNSLRDLVTITGLGQGNYKLILRDGGNYLCDMATLNVQILSCDEPGLPVTLKVSGYNLPVGPSAFVKVLATNTGGPCKYSWSINTYKWILTDGPRIEYIDLQKILLGENSTDKVLTITSYCPCGDASTKLLLIEPCNNGNSRKQIKYLDGTEIASLCFGVLPTGKVCNYRNTAKIKLRIDLRQKFNVGDYGDIQFNKYLSKVEWLDGTPVNKSFSMENGVPVLTIERDVYQTGKYVLYFTDGRGCIFSEIYEIKNSFTFESEGSSADKCIFFTYCEDKNQYVHRYYETEIRWLDEENCKAQMFCGNQALGSVMNGHEYLGPQISTPGPNGKCRFLSYCFFEELHEFIDPDKNSDFVHFTKTRPDQSTLHLYGLVKEIESDCCEPNSSDIEASVVSRLHFKSELESSSIFPEQDPVDNPCILYYLCPAGYKKIVGEKSSVSFCRDNEGNCFEIQYCIYRFGNEPNQIVVNTQSQANARLRVIRKVDGGCDISTPDCSVFTNPQPLTGLYDKSNPKFKIIPNPFGNHLQINLDPILDGQKFKIQIIDLLGKNVFHQVTEMDKGENRILIKTSDWQEGIYFLELRAEGVGFTQKIIKVK